VHLLGAGAVQTAEDGFPIATHPGTIRQIHKVHSTRGSPVWVGETLVDWIAITGAGKLQLGVIEGIN
jgi:hypothetical protein